METKITNKGPGDNAAAIELLQMQVDELKAALQAAMSNPAVRASNVMLARESRRLQRQSRAATEVSDSKMVTVRTRGFLEKIVNKKVQRIPTSGRPIAISSTWRSRGIWPDAPSVLQAEDEKGDPVTHTIPRRVYEALKDHLELVPA